MSQVSALLEHHAAEAGQPGKSDRGAVPAQLNQNGRPRQRIRPRHELKAGNAAVKRNVAMDGLAAAEKSCELGVVGRRITTADPSSRQHRIAADVGDARFPSVETEGRGSVRDCAGATATSELKYT
jgi:hypothetical protein